MEHFAWLTSPCALYFYLWAALYIRTELYNTHHEYLLEHFQMELWWLSHERNFSRFSSAIYLALHRRRPACGAPHTLSNYLVVFKVIFIFHFYSKCVRLSVCCFTFLDLATFVLRCRRSIYNKYNPNDYRLRYYNKYTKLFGIS